MSEIKTFSGLKLRVFLATRYAAQERLFSLKGNEER